MPDPRELRVDDDGATRFLTLERPAARNALTLPLVELVSQAFAAAAADPAVRCVVLSGAGGHFCAGADLRAAASDPEFRERADVYLDAFHGLLKSVVRCPKPVIAMMEGAAVGFGADLAFACDLRVAAHGAYAQEKFVHIGLVPDGGGTFWLPRLVGTARAMQSILLGDRLEASLLLSLGVVWAVVDAPALRETTRGLARRLEAGSPLALAAAKRTVLANLGDIDEALRREREEQLRLLRTEDFAEAAAAFAQKRDPVFRGR